MIISIDQAQSQLTELVERVNHGEEVILTQDEKPVARLISVPNSEPNAPRVPGLMKGILTVIEEDDEHLSDFSEYM